MFKTPFAAAALAALLPAHAAVSVSAPSFTYDQSFDSLSTPTWANDSTLPGWSLVRTSGVVSLILGTGSSNTGGFYSFGSSGSGERALGSLASGGTGTTYIAVAFTNATGGVLDGFTAGYDGEQWRNGGNTTAQSLLLEYGYGNSLAAVSGWTALSTFTSPVTGATAAALDGNGAGRVTGLGGTVSTAWAAGDTLWLRWADLNDSGNDHGLAIDNFSFSVTAVPEPQSWALMLAGAAALGFVVRRRA